MLPKTNKLKIEKNIIKINKFIISKNWYELINDSEKKEKLKKLCTEKKTIVYLNKNSQLTKKQIIDFSTKENILISKIYHNNHLILNKNTYKLPTTKLICFLLIIINFYLYKLNLENMKIKTNLTHHQNQLILQLSNLKKQKNTLKKPFNSTITLLKQLNCITESISIKLNKSVSISVISLTNLEAISSQLKNLNIQTNFITDIGGSYEITFNY